MNEQKIKFPGKGTDKGTIFSEMRASTENDVKWRDGKAFSMVFYPGKEVAKIQEEAYESFFFENGLNPTAFPSLRKFETEVVSMSADLVNGDSEVVGNMTSGGTESILCAVKAARDKGLGENPDIKPELIVPLSAHPAFDKAGHYFGVKVIHAPLREDKRVDVVEVKKLINENTIMLVGSAPAYPHGVIDPIEELGQVALKNNLLLHVDSCVGGYILPFVERLGYDVPKFDFRVPGVTSMSMDLHKYAYVTKGASVILYKNSELRKKQYFVYTGWPGGIYASPSISGSRSGGVVAAAWATLRYLGEEGYLQMAKASMRAADKLKNFANETDGIHIISNPEATVMAIGSDEYNILNIGDELSLKGWHIDRQQNPSSLHITISYENAKHIDAFLEDLQAAVKKAKRFTLHKLSAKATVGAIKGASKVLSENAMSKLTKIMSKLKKSGLPKRTAAMYGMMGALPNKGDLDQIILNMLDGLNRVE